MEDDLRANLKAVAEVFCAATGLAHTTVWARAAKDARFIDRVESGKGFTVRTYDVAMAWFSDHWPAEAAWPSDIVRPAPTHVEAAE